MGPAAGRLSTARLIGASMAGGVTLFAVVSWFLHRQAPPPGDPAQAGLFLYVWLLLALATCTAAVVWWRLRVAPVLERPEPGETTQRDDALLTGLIVTWALIEAPAIVGVVVYFLFGRGWTGAAGVALMWIGLALTWPRDTAHFLR